MRWQLNGTTSPGGSNKNREEGIFRKLVQREIARKGHSSLIRHVPTRFVNIKLLVIIISGFFAALLGVYGADFRESLIPTTTRMEKLEGNCRISLESLPILWKLFLLAKTCSSRLPTMACALYSNEVFKKKLPSLFVVLF